MKSETILTIGAIAAGAYLVYKIAPEIVNTLKPAEQVTGAVGNVAEKTGGAIGSWLDAVNIKTYEQYYTTKQAESLAEVQKETSKPKYNEKTGQVGIFDTTGTYGIGGYGSDSSSKTVKSTQDFSNPTTQANLQKLFSGTSQTPVYQAATITQKEKDAINKAYNIFGVKTRI